ncbi:hypothetical protein T12_14090 [Trichinella patagoniensis]|uniref:Uncharacterized protein n=1 Tax=Trichinella patagoniensis TaxID=990121 RepID=A0A0V1A167_9BILA|nr:hypothetical protein T12_14090 [Trichinella patagoniensis]
MSSAKRSLNQDHPMAISLADRAPDSLCRKAETVPFGHHAKSAICSKAVHKMLPTGQKRLVKLAIKICISKQMEFKFSIVLNDLDFYEQMKF